MSYIPRKYVVRKLHKTTIMGYAHILRKILT